MTTKAQAEANRANAKRSTGPKSSSGKARVARNATRHGATRAPDPEQVEDWFRVIMGVPQLGPADILKDDDTTRLALRLAGEEVRLASAQAALDEYQANPDVLSRNPLFQSTVESVGEAMAFDAGAMEEDEIEYYYALARQEFFEKISPLRIYSIEMRLLRRYLREAQGQRNRAFRDWIEHLPQAGCSHGHNRNQR